MSLMGGCFNRFLTLNYTYLYRHRRVHKFNFRKSSSQNNPSLSYSDGLTESELAQMRKKRWTKKLA